MRITLLSLVLVAGLGHAQAADWHRLPRGAGHGLPQGRSASDAMATPQIINGVPTSAYPAVAGLRISNPAWVGLCTGTLVSPSVVLTAAHCVSDSPLAIRATFFPDGRTAARYAVTAYAIHLEYRFPDADLALLLLEAPVAGVSPVPLSERKPRSGTRGMIVGYGEDEQGTTGVKQMGSVRLKTCPRRMPALGLLPGSLSRALCWRARRGRQNTCHGDSGGPLLVEGMLAGVTSGGEPNCSGLLSWDTSVASFLPWIRARLR